MYHNPNSVLNAVRVFVFSLKNCIFAFSLDRFHFFDYNNKFKKYPLVKKFNINDIKIKFNGKNSCD